MDLSRVKLKDFFNPTKIQSFFWGTATEKGLATGEFSGFEVLLLLMYKAIKGVHYEVEEKGIEGLHSLFYIDNSVDYEPIDYFNIEEGLSDLNLNMSLTGVETILYRSIVCRPCVEKGSCLECGCRTPENMMAPMNYCELDKWGAQLPKDMWEDFKKENKINFKIK